MKGPHAPFSTSLRPIASFERYEDAEALVNQMTDAGVPIEKLTIAGRDLVLVERVTGRMTASRAALSGALSMMWFSALFGVLFGVIFAPSGASVVATIGYWLLVGAAMGAGLGLVYYLAVHRGRRNFASETMIQASRFEVLAEASVADDVERWLAQPDTIAIPEAAAPTSANRSQTPAT